MSTAILSLWITFLKKNYKHSPNIKIFTLVSSYQQEIDMTRDAKLFIEAAIITIVICIGFIIIESSTLSNHDQCKLQKNVSYDVCMYELMPR